MALSSRQGAGRYFVEDGTPSGEFAGIEPGKLSEELRAAMGIGPLDPPPWLPRMRALGYPPGYRCVGHSPPQGCKLSAEFIGDVWWHVHVAL